MLTGLVRYRRVEDATTAKDEPTQVYLLEELVKAAQSSPEDAQHIVEHLIKKLDSRSPVVKAKALKACKYLVQKGAKDAHRIFQRNAVASLTRRALQNFKGPVDALKGDALNERVRTLAKETVAAIFSPEAIPATTGNSTAQSRIQGFGSGPMTTSIDGGIVDASSKMVGIGNEHFNQPTPNSSSIRSFQTTTTTFTTRRQVASFLPDNPTNDEESTFRRVQENSTEGNVIGSEEELVNNICQPSGVRSAPAAEDMRRFIDTAGSLDGRTIAEKLHQKLKSHQWVECYRALCAIEAVIQKGSSVSCGEIGVYFQGDLDIIRRCLQSQQKSIRERAQKIMNIFIEVDDEAKANPAPKGEETPPLIDDVVGNAQSATKTDTAMLDLLDDGADKTVPPAGMFTGLELPSPEPVKTATAAPVVQAGVESSTPDMFSGLNTSNTSTPATKGSNQHLAALLAPPPAADPFPEASTPLKAEPTNLGQQSLSPPSIQPQMQYPMKMGGTMPGYTIPQAPSDAGAMYGGHVPMMPPAQQPVMNPDGYPPQMAYGYPNYHPPTQAQNFRPPPGDGNRGEVPLSFFMGPAHIEKRNSIPTKKNSAFSFVGDHISQLRDKK